MKELPKILLVSTINKIKSYCLFDWLKHIKTFNYPNYEVFLCDNSNDPTFHKEIIELGFNCVYEPPRGRDARYFITASLERCRVKFLAGSYDYMFILECDIFPPINIIQKLLIHDKDVVGTTYWTESGDKSRLQLMTIYNFNTNFANHQKEYKVRYLTFFEAQLFIDGECKPSYANGIGCVLIRRPVLEKIAFRIDPLNPGFADSFFYEDLWKNGIQNYCDTSVIPLHRNMNWNTILSDFGQKVFRLKNKN